MDYFLASLREPYTLISPLDMPEHFEKITVEEAVQFWDGRANNTLKGKLARRSSFKMSIAQRLASQESAELMLITQYFTRCIGLEELNLRLEKFCGKEDQEAQVLKNELLTAIAALLSNTSEKETEMVRRSCYQQCFLYCKLCTKATLP